MSAPGAHFVLGTEACWTRRQSTRRRVGSASHVRRTSGPLRDRRVPRLCCPSRASTLRPLRCHRPTSPLPPRCVDFTGLQFALDVLRQQCPRWVSGHPDLTSLLSGSPITQHDLVRVS